MRPRSRQCAVVDAVVILALFSTAKAVGAAQDSRNSWSTTGRRPYPNGPCTISAGNGDEVVGRLIPSPSCRMPRGVGPFPSPPTNECFDCIPVTGGYDGENFVGVEESWRGGEEAITERTSLEDPQVTVQALDKKLALVVADATRDAAVGGEKKDEEKELNSIAGKIGEIATGILAAVAAAAAAAVASVFTGALTEAKAGTLSASPESPHGDAFGTITERSDPPEMVISRRKPVIQGQDTARLRGAGGEFHGEGWRDSASGVGGDAVGPGVFGGDAGEAAEAVRRRMQELTPAPTAAVSTSETAAPAPVAVETDAPADAESNAPAAVETDAPADAETNAPAAAETAAPAAGETDAPVAGETPAPTLGATPESSSEEELTISPTPVNGETISPSGTLAPGETLAPSTSPAPADGETVSPSGTRAPGETLAPSTSPAPVDGETVSPSGTRAPGETLAPSISPAPVDGETVSPSGTRAPGETFVPTISPAPVDGETVSPSGTRAPGETFVTTISPAPVDGETVSPSGTRAPGETFVTTISPAPVDGETVSPSGTRAPGETFVPTISPAPVNNETVFPTETRAPGETFVPTISPAPVDGETFSPSGTRAPGETFATAVPSASASTLAPSTGETLLPGAMLAQSSLSQSPSLLGFGTPSSAPSPFGDGETQTPSSSPIPTAFTLSPLAPGGTPAPSAAPTPLLTTSVGPTVSSTSPAPSASPSISPSSMSPTPAPTNSNSSVTDEVTPAPTNSNSSATEEALETTGDVASGAVAVGVAATAAVATVTAVTATTVTTTAVTTTAASGTVTSTLTTTVTTAASAGTGGGTSGTGAGVAATGTGTTTTSTTAAQSGTQTVTSANTSGVQQTTRAGMRSSVQSNTGRGANVPTVGVDQGSYVSARSPSASLGLLMILQIQFLSLLRLLEANITEPFMDFLDSIKWLNLHFEIDASFLKCNDEAVRFSWSNDDNGTWAFNTFLVFGCLALLIVVHILALSFMEASWLSQANAIHRHRLDLLRQHNAQEAAAPIDGSSSAAYARYLDAQNQDRELYEQEIQSAERYLRRHNSAWLYFPHIELLFLLFAYQGASAAEARMIYSGCLPLVVLGVCAMVIFPVLMFIYVNRIVWSRLRPSNSPLVFRPNPEAKRGCGFLCMSLCCVCNAWRKGTSMFQWADKGEWVSKNDEDVDLDSRKFRIGFEPLFVDYTQRGTIYVSYLLFEWLLDGLVSGFVTNGTIQTGIIFLIYLGDLLILVCLRPFANSMIQFITTLTVLADVLTVALMCYASTLDEDDDSERLDYIYAGVLVVQTATIIFFVVPLYLDSFIVMTSLFCRKMRGLYEKTTKREKPPIKGSCGETTRIFLALVRENFFGCLKSTWKGPSYKPDSPGELERRRSTLLQPISEVESEDGTSFSYRSVLAPPSRVTAHLLPTARNPVRTSDGNALQDFSDHGSNNLTADTADDREQHHRRASRGSAGAVSRSSRGALSYEREPPSERR